jgi:hypothetical protein
LFEENEVNFDGCRRPINSIFPLIIKKGNREMENINIFISGHPLFLIRIWAKNHNKFVFVENMEFSGKIANSANFLLFLFKFNANID